MSIYYYMTIYYMTIYYYFFYDPTLPRTSRGVKRMRGTCLYPGGSESTGLLIMSASGFHVRLWSRMVRLYRLAYSVRLMGP